ncbi:MAG: DUF6131 family protein [Actinobacteria bacterium]|nr:DUF6131 family protein [Actinomycetota bacterium]
MPRISSHDTYWGPPDVHPILWTLGIILVVIGVVLVLLGTAGHAIGGRRHYF